MKLFFLREYYKTPYFNPDADDAINYGGIGMVIGHEMTHGFDDEGSQFDKEGNLKTWWSAEDSKRFKTKTKLVIDQYNKFTVLDTLHVNGALTTGEKHCRYWWYCHCLRCF